MQSEIFEIFLKPENKNRNVKQKTQIYCQEKPKAKKKKNIKVNIEMQIKLTFHEKLKKKGQHKIKSQSVNQSQNHKSCHKLKMQIKHKVEFSEIRVQKNQIQFKNLQIMQQIENSVQSQIFQNLKNKHVKIVCSKQQTTFYKNIKLTSKKHDLLKNRHNTKKQRGFFFLRSYIFFLHNYHQQKTQP
eukprot:TRINITY_DN13372_c0_g1_i5.p1 TRINITY_DN13372_c0_g1~~TRINITY_DN13372_c0_g1_i5.p1  ORF type:complete len:186 (-),score=-2.05 TRINITY_DN13372_c0_g1_i5:246-803(-)